MSSEESLKIDQTNFNLLDHVTIPDAVEYMIGPVSSYKLIKDSKIIYLFGDMHNIHTNLELDSKTIYLPIWLYHQSNRNNINIYLESVEPPVQHKKLVGMNSGLLGNTSGQVRTYKGPI
jgi:hypothetical protein